LKPGFFENEKLASLPAHARLLFAGLWIHADREGRLRDRPAVLHGLIFPHEDDIPVPALLDRLTSLQFIQRYRAGGASYIQVRNWHKHQHPHPREIASIIPPFKRARAVAEPLQSRATGKTSAGHIAGPSPSVPSVPSVPSDSRTKNPPRAENPARSPSAFFRTGEEAFGDERVKRLILGRDPDRIPDPEFWTGLFDTFRQAKPTASQVVTLRELETFFTRLAKVGHDALYRGASVYREKHPHKPMAYCIGIMTGEGRRPSEEKKANGSEPDAYDPQGDAARANAARILREQEQARENAVSEEERKAAMAKLRGVIGDTS